MKKRISFLVLVTAALAGCKDPAPTPTGLNSAPMQPSEESSAQFVTDWHHDIRSCPRLGGEYRSRADERGAPETKIIRSRPRENLLLLNDSGVAYEVGLAATGLIGYVTIAEREYTYMSGCQNNEAIVRFIPEQTELDRQIHYRLTPENHLSVLTKSNRRDRRGNIRYDEFERIYYRIR